MPRAAKKFYDLAHAAVAGGMKDNSFGAGYWPLPARLRRLLVYNISGSKRSHKVFPDDPTHMFTFDLQGFNIMEKDLQTLMELGLVRIQSNEPNQISLYFRGDPWKESDWR